MVTRGMAGQLVGSVVVLAVVVLLGDAWASPHSAYEEVSIGRLALALVEEEATPVAIATLVVCFAVLTRQAAMAYRKNWRLAFGLFPILFLGTIVFDRTLAVPSGNCSPGASCSAKFAVIFFASVFFAGVLAFWIKDKLYLLPVIAGAPLVTLLVLLLVESQDVQVILLVAAGITGGLCLHWWRDCWRKRKTPADGKGTTADAGGGLNAGSGCPN